MRQKQTRNRLFKRFNAAALAGWLIFCISGAVNAGETDWLTGESLRQSLDNEVAITWGNAPIQQALQRFSQSQRVAMFLDRRVDPGRKIELVVKNAPLRVALEQIASRLHSSTAMIGPVAYFGPSDAAKRVRTLVALRTMELAKLPPNSRASWQKLRPWKWENLAEPRDLLTSLSREIGVSLEGIQQIPHDLWPAADLPLMTMPERLTLILNQFDLTYELANQGKALRLVPAPNHPLLEQTYSVGKDVNQIVATMSGISLLQEAGIHVADGKLIVRGTAEEHDIVRDLLAGKTAKRVSAQEGRKLYTLRVELPVGKALKQLGDQLGLEVVIDQDAIAEAGISLDRKVKIDVKEATFDELFEALLTPANLTFVRNGDALIVKPKK
jgi:hypothetical protein